MNQRACLYFKDPNELKSSLDTRNGDFCHLSNKYRLCVFIESEQGESSKLIHEDSVFHLHEALTCFMTYQNKNGALTNPDQFMLTKDSFEFWCQDLDLWIGFPESITQAAGRGCCLSQIFFSSHSQFYSYDDLEKLLKK